MKRYFLIMICLAVLTGCESSVRSTANLSEAAPADVNSAGETDEDVFDEFEDELSQDQTAVPDPIESWNRTMFGVNDKFYFWIAKPVLQTYKNIAPQPVRICISNFFDNLTTPVRLVNCLIQGKGAGADRELRRFGINTTAGILGFGDPAHDKCNLSPANEDLGQSLAVHGLKDGFYVVWPVFGPSTLRDSAGKVGDMFLNPVRYVKPAEASIGMSVTDVVNDGSFHIGDYEDFKSASVDPYIAMRGAYIQYRSKQIKE